LRPTLIIAPLLTEEVREEARIIDADVLIENPPDTQSVSERINSRLRRARETVKVARRDPVALTHGHAPDHRAQCRLHEAALARHHRPAGRHRDGGAAARGQRRDRGSQRHCQPEYPPQQPAGQTQGETGAARRPAVRR